MKINHSLFWVAVIFQTFFCANIVNAKTIKLVLYDTTSKDDFQYRPFIELLKSVGFSVDYKPIDQIASLQLKKINPRSYDAAFFIFGMECLKTQETSSISINILKILEAYAKKQNKIIGLFFPPFRQQPGFNAIQVLAPIFNRIGLRPETILKENLENQASINLFLHVANNFLLMPVESRPLKYHTTLSLPHSGTPFRTEEILSASQTNLKLLPTNAACSEIIAATLPYGLYWYNPIAKNHVLIAQSTILSFSGITENFHFCPAKVALREEIHEMIQETLWELLQTVNKSTDANKPKLPSNLQAFGQSLKTKRLTGARKIGWIEINLFQDKTQTEKQNQLVDDIFDAGLDTLWISVNPQMYFCKTARYPRKNKLPSPEETAFLNSVSLFTQKLKQKSTEFKKPIPKILVGFEIANNLYPPNLPKNFACDLYGNSYQDLPAPLNHAFWQSEVKDGLNIFLKQWQKTEISHGLKLSGIVLDLEMYCRKITGSFSDTMGFEPETFGLFAKLNKIKSNFNSTNKIVSYLSKRNLTTKYYSFLQANASILGNELRMYFNKKIPGCLIMCYTPNISTTWFYKGLFKGLSSQKKPISLLTFNSEFAWHESWLTKNKIYLEHSSVLMLSKLQQEKDFAWVDKILSTHDGIWLNRFSRFVEEYNPKSWIAIEQTPMDQKEKTDFFQYLSHQHQ